MRNHKKLSDSDETIRYLVFKEGQHWCAVALELNIVETGSDPREVLFSLLEAIQGAVNSASKTGHREVLRQEINPEYENLWRSLKEPRGGRSKRPFPVYSFGHRTRALA